MSRTLPRDYRPLLAAAVKAGFTWRLTGSNHVRVFDPQGDHVLTLAGTPRGIRAVRDLRAKLKRRGVDV